MIYLNVREDPGLTFLSVIFLEYICKSKLSLKIKQSLVVSQIIMFVLNASFLTILHKNIISYHSTFKGKHKANVITFSMIQLKRVCG